ncbi:MAG: CHAT domain-containing protein [Armatimonadia bacterium]|nr:CHAT domain-containing protein [Armatimonadia bacterium]
MTCTHLRMALVVLIAGLLALGAAAQQDDALDRATCHRGIAALVEAGELEAALGLDDELRSLRLWTHLTRQGIDPYADVEGLDAAREHDARAERRVLVIEAATAETSAAALEAYTELLDWLASDDSTERLEAAAIDWRRLPFHAPEGNAASRLAGHLDEGTCLVVYIDTGQSVHAIVRRPHGSMEAVELAEADIDPTTASEEDLRRALVYPIEPLIADYQRVIAVPDAALLHVPFLALAPVGQDWIVGASLSHLLLALANEPRGDGPMLALCDPVFPPLDPSARDTAGEAAYEYLPPSGTRGAGPDDLRDYVYVPAGGARYVYVPVGASRGVDEQDDGVEVTGVARYFSAAGLTLPRAADTLRRARAMVGDAPAGSQLLQGLRASETAARERLEGSGTLYLGTHAVIDELNPFLSSVCLGHDPDHDGFLLACEILELKAVPSAVTIAGMRTLPGEPAQGDGLSALAWALAASGARSVTLEQPSTLALGWTG